MSAGITRFGISAIGAAGIGHAVADLETGHARANGFDGAGGLLAQAGRQRLRIETGAEIAIDEVQADGCMADADFATRARRLRRPRIP
jgi:hypothetical protein